MLFLKCFSELFELFWLKSVFFNLQDGRSFGRTTSFGDRSPKSGQNSAEEPLDGLNSELN